MHLIPLFFSCFNEANQKLGLQLGLVLEQNLGSILHYVLSNGSGGSEKIGETSSPHGKSARQGFAGANDRAVTNQCERI